MMGGCNKCCTMTSVLLIALGVAYLLVDMMVWNFWNINWWTAVFLLMGIISLAKSSCKDCRAAMKR